MIVGIGNDILEIDRIRKAIEKESFMTKYYTEAEIAYFERRKNNPSTIAANFSAKEAVSKAFGTGIRGFALKDIEVLRNDLGRPTVTLYNQAKILAEELDINKWHITISHTDTLVSVVVIGESR